MSRPKGHVAEDEDDEAEDELEARFEALSARAKGEDALDDAPTREKKEEKAPASRSPTSRKAGPAVVERARAQVREFGRFLVAGAAAVATVFVLNLVFATFLAGWLATLTAFLVGALLAFVLNRVWVFRAGGALRKEIWQFAVLYLASVVVGAVVNQSLQFFKVGGAEDMGRVVAWFTGTVAYTLTSYIGMKSIVFRHKKKEKA